MTVFVYNLSISAFKLTIVRYFAFLMKIVDTIY